MITIQMLLKSYRAYLIIVLAIVGLGAGLAFKSEQAPLILSARENAILTQQGISKIDVPAERALWRHLVQIWGPEKTYKEFKKFDYAQDLYTQHGRAHIFGEELFSTAGINAIKACDSDFGMGCYHGFAIRGLYKNGLTVLADIGRVCNSLGEEKSDSCAHGIGHGVMSFLGNGKLSEALQACDRVDPRPTIAGCPSGVFMELHGLSNIPDDESNLVLAKLDLQNPYSPCPEIPDKFQPACYHSQGVWWGESNLTYKRMGELCSGVEHDANRSACFEGVGVSAAFYKGEFMVNKTIGHCQEVEDRSGRDHCLLGAAFIFAGLQRDKKNETAAICDTLKLPEVKDICSSILKHS